MNTNLHIRVLIIEDNQDLARLFCDLVEVQGCVAQAAWNARSGIATAIETTPDIVFCDLTMPGDKNGFDVAREIRAHPDLSDTLLIAVTGFAHADAYARALEAGFEQVFAKPVKFAQLQKVLNDYKARPR